VLPGALYTPTVISVAFSPHLPYHWPRPRPSPFSRLSSRLANATYNVPCCVAFGALRLVPPKADVRFHVTLRALSRARELSIYAESSSDRVMMRSLTIPPRLSSLS